MAQQKREVMAIANNPAAPTFNNTLVPLERSGLLLERAGLAFQAVNGANTNDTLQATDTKTAPLFAAHNDFIFLNAKLFARVKSLHDRQAELNLNPEQAKLLDVYYKQFEHAGAELPAAKQTSSRRSTGASARCRPNSDISCRTRPRPAPCTSPTRPRSRACRTSRSRRPPRPPRAASSTAMSCRCRTPPSSRRWSR